MHFNEIFTFFLHSKLMREKNGKMQVSEEQLTNGKSQYNRWNELERVVDLGKNTLRDELTHIIIETHTFRSENHSNQLIWNDCAFLFSSIQPHVVGVFGVELRKEHVQSA